MLEKLDKLRLTFPLRHLLGATRDEGPGPDEGFDGMEVVTQDGLLQGSRPEVVEGVKLGPGGQQHVQDPARLGTLILSVPVETCEPKAVDYLQKS